jgi:hypothetical protein
LGAPPYRLLRCGENTSKRKAGKENKTSDLNGAAHELLRIVSKRRHSSGSESGGGPQLLDAWPFGIGLQKKYATRASIPFNQTGRQQQHTLAAIFALQ